MIIKGYKSKPIYSLKQKRSTVDINDVTEYKFLLTDYSIITILNHSVLFPSKNNLRILQKNGLVKVSLCPNKRTRFE